VETASLRVLPTRRPLNISVMKAMELMRRWRFLPGLFLMVMLPSILAFSTIDFKVGQDGATAIRVSLCLFVWMNRSGERSVRKGGREEMMAVVGHV